MTSIASPTYDQVLNGMVTRLQPLTLAAGGSFHVAKRYMGERFDEQEFSLRGVAGRCPAVLVAFSGERSFRTTIGRRRDRVEATFLAICVSDSHRSKDDRAAVLGMLYAVRKQLGDTKLGLAISPLRYGGVVVVAEAEMFFAYAVRFVTRYSVDYTINPGGDVILSADGQIVYPVLAPLASPVVAIVGAPGAAVYAYDVQALFSGGPSSDFSAWTEVTNAPNALSVTNKLTIMWQPVAGASGYVLRRRWSPAGGPTAGVIYTGTATTFTDDGSVAGTGRNLPERGIDYHGAF